MITKSHVDGTTGKANFLQRSKAGLTQNSPLQNGFNPRNYLCLCAKEMWLDPWTGEHSKWSLSLILAQPVPALLMSSGAKTSERVISVESLDMTALSWRGKEFDPASAAPKTLGKDESTNMMCAAHTSSTPGNCSPLPGYPTLRRKHPGDLQIAVTAREECTVLEKSRGQDRPQLVTQIRAVSCH